MLFSHAANTLNIVTVCAQQLCLPQSSLDDLCSIRTTSSILAQAGAVLRSHSAQPGEAAAKLIPYPQGNRQAQR